MIYLDHAATTPVHQEVLQAMYEFERDIYGNPSSAHALGRKTKMHLEAARKTLAKAIHAVEKEIIFTSGGTEANNLAIVGTAYANQHKGKHIITSTQEHQAVLETMEFLADKGFTITYLPVNDLGVVSVEELTTALTDETILVSIMTVNNETGIIQPIEACVQVVKDHQAYFHTDAVQAFGVMEIDVRELGVDLLTISAHKVNGPKGVGVLFVRSGIKLQPIHYGGNQERKLRPGTENVVGAVGFQKATEIIKSNQVALINQAARYNKLFIETLAGKDIVFEINGEQSSRVLSIINIHFENVSVDSLLTNLDLAGIAASSGSACTAGTTQPSHVLIAMYGETAERINQSVRFSFGLANNEENVIEAAEEIAKIVNRLQK